MKRVLILATFIFSVVSVRAQEQDPWEEYMMPGDMQRMLESYVGEFDLTITMFMTNGGEPIGVTVSSINTMIMGGRFLELRQSGEMMETYYEATTIIGYNNSSKKMELTTMTNMGTGILYLAGDWNAETKTANLSGRIVNPMNKKAMVISQLVQFKDANAILIQNFDGAGKKAQKSIEYLFVRKS